MLRMNIRFQSLFIILAFSKKNLSGWVSTRHFADLFALINKFEWEAMLFIIGLNYIILIVTGLLKKRFYGQPNHTAFYLFSIFVTVVSPMLTALLFIAAKLAFGMWCL